MMGRKQSKMAPGVWDLIMERDRWHHKKPAIMRKLKRSANHHYRKIQHEDLRREMEQL